MGPRGQALAWEQAFLLGWGVSASELVITCMDCSFPSWPPSQLAPLSSQRHGDPQPLPLTWCT